MKKSKDYILETRLKYNTWDTIVFYNDVMHSHFEAVIIDIGREKLIFPYRIALRYPGDNMDTTLWVRESCITLLVREYNEVNPPKLLVELLRKEVEI